MKDLSLYIHIPFCRCICVYCAFLTYANKTGQIPLYIDSLLKEIDQRSPALRSYRISSIYFGGGTPGLLETDKISLIMGSLKKNFKISETAEISIECNPENINADKVAGLMKLGFNRLTMGVQSLKKDTLLRLARTHDVITIKDAVETLKKVNFKNFGIDLIMGLPHQDINSFRRDLDQIIDWEVPHISCYFLSYDTPKIDNFIKDCPDEAEQIDMYDYACRKLKENGFLHYEVSNFAIPGHECKHNLRYWNQKEYLGLGHGAHSYMNDKVWSNTSDFNAYLNNPLLTDESIVHDPDLQRMDFIMLHLRKHDGIRLKEFSRKFPGRLSELRREAAKYKSSGHLYIDSNKLALTEKGFLIIDRITGDLL